MSSRTITRMPRAATATVTTRKAVAKQSARQTVKRATVKAPVRKHAAQKASPRATGRVTKAKRPPMVRVAKAPPTLRVLVASGQRINLTARRLTSPTTKDWQSEAWIYFDDITEIKEPVWYLGNQMAKLRLYVGVPGPDGNVMEATSAAATEPREATDGTPIPAIIPPAVAAAAADDLAGVRSLDGGHADLLRGIEMNLEVPGECWLVGFAERVPSVEFPEGAPADWRVCSTDEIDVKGKYYVVKDTEDDTKGRKIEPDEGDVLFRIWLPHPRWKTMADSLMKGVLPDCRILQAITQQQLAESYSRLSAGFFTWPNGLNKTEGTTADPDDDGGEGDEPKKNPQLAKLVEALSKPIEDTSHPYGQVPPFIEGEAELLKPDVLRHISIARPIDATIDARKDKSVERIARGMNLPVEKVMGHQETTFANAAQVDEDEYDDYLAPRTAMITTIWTTLVMRPIWRDNPAIGEEWADVLSVEGDPAAMIASPNVEANANDAFDRFTISDQTYRRVKGYSEDDAPTPDERRERIGARRGILTADITKALLETMGEPIEVTESAEAPSPDAPSTTPPDESGDARVVILAETAAARRRRRKYNIGQDLTAMDRELRTRLIVATDAALQRALERAGNRIRAKVDTQTRRTVRNVPARRVASYLGPALVADVADDLFEGAWDGLEGQFKAWAGEVGDQATKLVSQVTSGFTQAERETLKLRQVASVDEAWSWFRNALETTANDRLFVPDAAVVAAGEAISADVSPGMVRQAISRAGGATGLITEDGGAFVALVDGGSRPAGGVATGELIRDVLRDNGAGVEGYVWVYGPAIRKTPFQPHEDLDGVEFVNFDDDVLANDAGWPEVDFFFPGDHDGCVCDFEPVILSAVDAGVDVEDDSEDDES